MVGKFFYGGQPAFGFAHANTLVRILFLDYVLILKKGNLACLEWYPHGSSCFQEKKRSTIFLSPWKIHVLIWIPTWKFLITLIAKYMTVHSRS